MKSWLLALSFAVLTPLAVAPIDAEAARLGGGKPAGMQRQMPAKPVDAAKPTPASPAATPGVPAAAGAAAAAGKRSWMGPLAGLAAGLGLAALFSHFGMGEGLANFMMIALLAVAALFLVRFVMSRMRGGSAQQASGGPQPAMAGAGAGAGGWTAPQAAPVNADAALQRQALDPAAPAGAAFSPVALASASPPVAGAALPGGMAQDDFLRLAKMVYIRLQAANDAGNVDDLRKFTTPELFASLRLDLQERGSVAQKTDVVQLDAEIADVAQENGQDVVSVRFHGLIREKTEGGAEPVNELWHLVRSTAGTGDWAIAGITTLA